MRLGNKKLIYTSILFVTLSILSFSSYLGAIELVFKTQQYSFQLLRTIGYSSTGGADIAECISTAYRIKEGDNESWYKEWSDTAKRLEKTADQFLKKRHNKSAREAYLRASNYYRTAEFFLHTDPADPRIIKTWEKSRESFQKAAKLSVHPIKFVRIPFEDTTLPGYLLLTDDSQKKRPLLIIHSGFDGTAEELYFEIGALAVKRGYNVLLFEGPGQGEVIREQKIPFRPNWETVVTPVVNFALELAEVDPEKIGLVGFSLGGFLAPRAAAFEHRFKVCVANGGVYDFYENAMKKSPPNMEGILQDKEASLEFDKEIMKEMKTDVDTGWFFANGMFTFKAATPSEFLRMLKPYNMKDSVKKIKSIMLVVDSEEDKDLPGQAKQLFEALESPKEFMLFTKEEGAEEHCQMGAIMISSERILNWLDDNLM
jgi:dipeptidyl aminopeptidase/acylaminoacyl peptidase